MKTLYRVFKWIKIFNVKEKKSLMNYLKILKKTRSTQSEKIIRYLEGLTQKEYIANEALHIKKVKIIFFGKGYEQVGKTQFANKIRYLIDFIESYTIYIHTNEDKQYRKVILKNILKKKGLNEESERIRNSFLKHYENTEKQGMWQFYQQFEILHNKYHDSINNISDSKKGQDIFQDMFIALDDFLIVSKLKIACEALMRNKFLNEKNQIPLITAIELEASYLAPNSYIIQMYLQVLRLIKEEADWDIIKLNKFFKKHKDKLYREDLHFLLISLINYINDIINKTKEKAAHKAALDFYRMLLDEVYLKVNQEIHPSLLKNIIVLALSLDQKLFAEQIVNKYSNKIISREKESNLQLYKAIMLCYEKNWKRLAPLLLTINVKDIHIGTAVYNYQVICAYEDSFLLQKDKDLVLKYLKTFAKYLNRQAIDPNVQLMYNNMIIFVSRLVKNSSDIINIRYDFDHTVLIASKKWLNEKITAIEKL